MIRRPRKTNSRRRGSSVVEMAVCLPLLVTMVFGSIQACNLLFLKHSVTTAVYEGTLEASKPGATRQTVSDRATNMLTAFGITGGSVSISPAGDLADMAPGTEVTITVSVPVNGNVTGPAIVSPKANTTSSGVSLR